MKLKNINCKYPLYLRIFEVKKMKIACFNSVNHILQKKKTVENRHNKSYTDIKIIITYQPTCFMQAIYIIVQPIFQVSFIKH